MLDLSDGNPRIPMKQFITLKPLRKIISDNCPCPSENCVPLILACDAQVLSSVNCITVMLMSSCFTI